MLKIGAADADAVKAVKAQLAAYGYGSASPPGVFDGELASIVKLFQSQHVDAAGRALKADGIVGPLTWAALFASPHVDLPATGPAATALAAARSKIGVMEQPPGSNSGPEVTAFLTSVGAHQGDAWCMAFVSWCFQQAANNGAANAFPRTAGCLDAWNDVRGSSPQRIVTRAAAIADPGRVKPGMVFILDHGGGHGHTGFVTRQLGGALGTVEGNSNDTGAAEGVGVFALNRRSVMESDLKGFLDFTF
ncbi:MAG: peptidoglycan-binding protein [Phenylobacterium sp.]